MNQTKSTSRVRSLNLKIMYNEWIFLYDVKLQL